MRYELTLLFLLLTAAAAFATPTLPRHGVFGAAVVDKAAGVTVMRVIPNSAAATAGVKAGDAIKSIGGIATPTVASFIAAVHMLHAGQTVSASLLRNGSPLQISVTLGRPADENDPDVTTLYQAIDVDGSLRRTLVTVPKGATSRLPAVLLIGGIGCFSVDAAANPNDAYMRITHDLSRAGFVTMRVEKSGVGDSQGPPCPTVDFLSEERGYGIALSALRNDPHVDPRRIYLLGHSIGSVIAPRLANTQHVAGVIVAEAVGRDWLEYETRNARRQLELTGAPPADVDAKVIDKQVCMYRLLVQKEPEAAIERSMPACKDPNSVYPVEAAFVQQVAALNIIQPWTTLNVPVLVVYGKSDFVTEEADHARIAEVVNSAHPNSATLKSIDGMDHLLFRAATPKAAMDAFQNGSAREYDTDFSRTIIAWLQKTA
jgi:pimeloyl-ACP methyl ester carboxylesterase